MGIFDKALNAAKSVGNAAIKAGSNAGTTMQDNSEIAGLKMEINSIKQELDASYAIIGKRYVQYVIDTGDMPGIDVADVLKEIDPKVTRKQELEKQLVEAQKRLKDANLLKFKQQAEAEYSKEKEKLDQALAMDVLSQDEYNYRLAKAEKRRRNFEEVRRVQSQFDMGLITKEQMNAKIDELTQ